MNSLKIKREDNANFYKELLEVFKDNNPDFLKSLTKDELIGLDHVLDFEDYVFMVINYETVVVVFDGTISGVYSMEKFSKLTREIIKE